MEKPSPALAEATTNNTTPGASATIVRPQHNVTLFQVFFTFCLSFAAFICNFDTAFAGAVLVMPSFGKAFGHCSTEHNASSSTVPAREVCTLTVYQQSIISLTTIFVGIGSLVSGPASSILGRQRSIQGGCVVTIIGAAGMLGTEGNFAAFVACKCLGALGIGCLFTIGPVYGAEAAPPQARGRLMSMYGFGHGFGHLMAGVVCLASSQLKSSWAWKTPVACQIPVGLTLCLSMFILPESPRWLTMKGRVDEAAASFAKLFNKDAQSVDIALEISNIQRNLAVVQSSKPSASWLQIFRGTNLRRTAIASLILYGNAVTGIIFVASYGVLFLSKVGLSNPLRINVMLGSLMVAGLALAPFLMERLGRRINFMVGYSMMALCMLAIAVTGSILGDANYTAHIVCTVFLCLWCLCFSCFPAPCIWVASAEMHSVPLRSHGQAFAATLYQLFSFAAAFWSPYTLDKNHGNMGTSVGYIYFGLAVCQVILTFVFVPETGQLTLEEIDAYFATGKPAWTTSLKKNRRVSRVD